MKALFFHHHTNNGGPLNNQVQVKFGQTVLLTITTLEREGKTADYIAAIPNVEQIHQTHLGRGAEGNAITLHYRSHNRHNFIQFTHVPGRWKFMSGEVHSCSPEGKIMMSGAETVGGVVTEGNLALDGFLMFLSTGGRRGLA